jgi:hypothetical protein
MKAAVWRGSESRGGTEASKRAECQASGAIVVGRCTSVLVSIGLVVGGGMYLCGNPHAGRILFGVVVVGLGLILLPT